MCSHLEGSVDSAQDGIVDAASPLNFDEVFTLYYRTVYRTARAIIRDEALAEDAVQEVFLKLHRSRRVWQEEERLRPWLLRVAVNVARNMVRGQSRAAVRDEQFMKSAEAATSDSSPGTLYEHRAELEGVLKALSRVREPMRSCLLLRQQGLSYREIAAALSVKESGAGTLLARAQKEFLKFYRRGAGSS